MTMGVESTHSTAKLLNVHIQWLLAIKYVDSVVKPLIYLIIYLGFRIQHCAGHITMGSWKGRKPVHTVCQGSVL